jgi:hypothetical protein
MDVQSVSSVNTPLPVYEEPVDYSIQLSVQQVNKALATLALARGATKRRRKIVVKYGKTFVRQAKWHVLLINAIIFSDFQPFFPGLSTIGS